MNTRERGLLLCTNGAPEGIPALHYGAWFAQVVGLPVTVLGIVEDKTQGETVDTAVRDAQSQLEAYGVAYTTLRLEGRARDVIVAEAVAGQHLVVLGPLGRPRWRQWVQGRSVRRLMSHLPVPLLYVPAAHCQLDRILVCTGALDPAKSLETHALHLAKRAGAALTVLHVIERVSYEYPISEQMKTHGDDFLQADIPQARNLRALLETARAMGISASVEIRHGTVVREIISAARHDWVDLVVMGSKHSSDSLRSLSLPDVTAEVMEALDRPVLSVQYSQPCIFAD